jgi:hypothetical protein
MNTGKASQFDPLWRWNGDETLAPMADDPGKRGAADRARINVNEPHELRYWTKELGVTEQELKAAVAKAGVMVEAVRSQLGK